MLSKSMKTLNFCIFTEGLHSVTSNNREVEHTRVYVENSKDAELKNIGTKVSCVFVALNDNTTRILNWWINTF